MPNRTNISTSSSSIQRQIEATAIQSFLHELKLAFLTSCFALVCIGIVVAAWYVSQWFANESYKAVVFFLDLIGISNMTSKYSIWAMKS